MLTRARRTGAEPVIYKKVVPLALNVSAPVLFTATDDLDVTETEIVLQFEESDTNTDGLLSYP